MTNEEFIKNLTAEELARVLKYATNCQRCPIRSFCHKNEDICEDCEQTWLHWLKSKKTLEDWNND